MNGRRMARGLTGAVVALGLVVTMSGGAAADDGLSFADASHGWRVGTETLLHTVDGGRTWTRQSLGTLPSGWRLSAACATGPATALVVGESGIFRTVNAGRTWRQVARGLAPTRTYGGIWTSCAFAGPRVGWVMSSGGDVIATTDAGSTWVRQRRASRSSDAEARGLVAAGRGRALMGVNPAAAAHLAGVGFGGAGWTPLSDVPFWWSNPRIVGIAATNPNTFWIATASGDVFRSIDAGRTWQPMNPDVGPTALWAQGLVASGATVIAYGVDSANRAAAVVSTDGGNSWAWSRLPAGTLLGIGGVDLITPEVGWASTAGGPVLLTVDGGRSWQVP